MTRLDWHPEQLIFEVEEKAEKLTDLMAEEVLESATSEVPKDTGALQESLHIQKESHKNAFIGSDKDYALFVEYGTRYQTAQPYLRPAIDELNGKVDGLIQQVATD